MSLAVQFFEYGPPEVLQLVDVPDRAPGPGQVRLRVRAAGVNPIEWKLRSGMMASSGQRELPSGLGTELAGVVDELGEDVSGLGVGDQMLGRAVTPAYAELAVCKVDDLVSKPDGISWEVAGGLCIGAQTSYRVLALLDLKPGETLLIHAAAGGVGIFATQVAIARGANVIGTAGAHNQGFLRSIGATPVLYGDGLADRVRAIAPDGVDAVLDCSGRGELPLSIELAGGPERVVTIVSAREAAELGAQFTGGPSARAIDVSGALPEAIELILAGHLEAPVWRAYPLAEAAAAHAESEAGHLRGKIVLVP
jgi:NADPH:quinone reductase-like Zn-dependent oxidoreductase